MSWVNAERNLMRQQVTMWIKVEGEPISLIRNADPVPSGAGGYVPGGPPETLPPVMRIVSTQAREQFLQGDVVGIGARLKKYLLGTYDDDIRQGDQFVWPEDGKTYTVEYVHSDRSVETRAELAELS